MLIDPLPIAASAPNPAYSYSMTKFDGYGSERLDSTSGQILTINHEKLRKGDRHYVKTAVTRSVLDTSSGKYVDETAYVSLVIFKPKLGFTDAEMVNLAKAHLDTLADSDFTTTRLLQFQS